MGHTVSTGIKMLRLLVPRYSYLKYICILAGYCEEATDSYNYTIIIPTKCTSFLLLKHKILQFVLFVFVFLAPTCFNPRGSSSGGAISVPNESY
jgi:hypothetical protein